MESELSHLDIGQRSLKVVVEEDKLREHWFPRPHPTIPGHAILYNVAQHVAVADSDTLPHRCCIRCLKQYPIQRPSGECRYHPGSLDNTPRPRYHCCNRLKKGEPCDVKPYHVTIDLDGTHFVNFMDLGMARSEDTDGVVGLACQLVYTMTGVEVAGLALVDGSCRVLYETLVLTDAPVLDYDTSNTGLEYHHFLGVASTRTSVQVKLATLLSPETVVVGHRLNHQLLRLRMIPHRIVDTSLLYAHPMAPTLSFTLADLTLKYLINYSFPEYHLSCVTDAIKAMLLLTRLL